MENCQTKSLMFYEEGKYVVREITLEETIEKFENALRSYAYKSYGAVSGYDTNVNDQDDYYVLGMMILMKCYEKYDINRKEKRSFNAFLSKALDNGLKKNSRFFKSNKRNEIFYTSNDIQDSYDIYDKKHSIDNVDGILFIESLCDCLTEIESKIVKEIFIGGMKKMTFSTKHNISRPTLNKKIDVTKEKCKKIIIEDLPSYSLAS